MICVVGTVMEEEEEEEKGDEKEFTSGGEWLGHLRDGGEKEIRGLTKSTPAFRGSLHHGILFSSQSMLD